MTALPANASGPLSRREGFSLHLFIFVIGSWNLAIINLSRSPDQLWFWPWVAAWAVALLLHLVVVLALSVRREPAGSRLRARTER